MQVVFTSGSVFMYISSVVRPLACMGGFLMEDGKLGIQEVNSSCRWEEESFESERNPRPWSKLCLGWKLGLALRPMVGLDQNYGGTLGLRWVGNESLVRPEDQTGL